MNLKTNQRKFAFIFVCLLALVLSACQSEQPVDELCPIDGVNGDTDEDCLPISPDGDADEAAYPIEEFVFPIEEELAYPITEADLSLLIRSWRMVRYTEDGVETEAPARTLTFNNDGTYTLSTPVGTETGTWSTILLAVDSTLILTPELEAAQYFQIVDLGEAELNLSTWREGKAIDEEYLPAD
jgi:hypothetical protein